MAVGTKIADFAHKSVVLTLVGTAGNNHKKKRSHTYEAIINY